MNDFWRGLVPHAVREAGGSPLVAGKLLFDAGIMCFRGSGKNMDEILKAFAIELADSERYLQEHQKK